MALSGRVVALSLVCLGFVVLSGVSATAHVGEPRTHTAVLDRFEGERAVLVFDGSQETAVVDHSVLPPAGRHANAVFDVSRKDGAVASIDHDRVASRERTHRSQSRFDRLSRPANGSTA